MPRLDFDETIASEAGQWKWLSQLNDLGVTIVASSLKHDAVETLARVISYPIVCCPTMLCHDFFVMVVQETIYGKDFTVVSTEGAINIAYTSLHLELHHDLVYLESPPGSPHHH